MLSLLFALFVTLSLVELQINEKASVTIENPIFKPSNGVIYLRIWVPIWGFLCIEGRRDLNHTIMWLRRCNKNYQAGKPNVYLWRGERRLLSQYLINSVPIYPMHVEKLPKSVCDKIERVQRDFLWGEGEGSRMQEQLERM